MGEGDVKILLAGGEAWWQTFAKYGIRYILFSYHYLRTQRDFRDMVTWMREAKARGHEDGKYFFMLDSGAYTFQVSKTEEQMGAPLNEYADEYIRFLEEDDCVDLFDTVAELDVYVDYDGVAGMDRVHDWRTRISDAVGPRAMPVLHAMHSEWYWQELLKLDYWPWVGIASGIGANGDVGTVSKMQRLAAQAHRAGKSLHAFGMTRLMTDMMYLRSYDTVDSTTWLRADKYGGTFIYHRGHMRILSHLQKEERAFFKGYFKSIGLSPEKILGTHMEHADNCDGPNSATPDCEACRDQLHELRATSLIAWRELAKRYDRANWGPFTNWRGEG